jgi:hypothetical protein
MGIDNFFLHFRIPRQFICIRDDYFELFEVDGKKVRKVDTVKNISVLDLDAAGFLGLKSKLKDKELGVILNSGHFIFNIFEFDKIPLRENLKRDLINWKIKKVFPENLDQYEHDYYKLDKKRILSILFKRSLKEKIESLASDEEFTITYLGNSTVEIMNNIFRGMQKPDFFLEMDDNLSIIVFQNGSVPFYIRKFRIENMDDVSEELQKTLHFVKNTYSMVPRSYALVSNIAAPLLNTIREKLSSIDIREMDFSNHQGLFLPGKK